MKKLLSVLLCLTMIISVAIPAVLAQNNNEIVVGDSTVFGDGEYPIVFVTGIGQSWSYMLDEEGGKTLPANNQYSGKANLFIFNFNRVLENLLANPSDILNVGVVVAQLIKTYIFNNYSVDYDRLCQLASSLLYENLIDENGNLPEHVFTPRYNYPISEYADDDGDYGKQRFYRDVPCREVLEQYGEEKVFCFNYTPFGNLSDVSKELDEYINDVVFDYYPDAGKVVLVPMSMGAAMVSQYLYDYGSKAQVARVVSIVGCWNGSDIVADLIEGKLIENSAELFYNDMLPMFMGDFTGNLLNLLLHLFHKENLSALIYDVLSAVCDEFLLKTPTLMALVPSYRYDAIREEYLTREGYENVLEQLDIYHEAQSNLKTRMEALNREQGIDFYFISGYNLGYGASINSDYNIFKFIYSSNKVNSDEIINIGSTAPGTTSVPAGQELDEEYLASADEKYISPDKSVDVSTCYYPDHCWLFDGQKHELGDNNVAINLAFEIAKGNITSTADCEETYPQFNDSRDVRGLRNDIEWFTDYIEENKEDAEKAEFVANCEKAVEDANALIANTIIDRAADDAKIAEIHKVRTDIENFGKEIEEPSYFDRIKDDAADKLNDLVYFVLGPKGIFDIF